MMVRAERAHSKTDMIPILITERGYRVCKRMFCLCLALVRILMHNTFVSSFNIHNHPTICCSRNRPPFHHPSLYQREKSKRNFAKKSTTKIDTNQEKNCDLMSFIKKYNFDSRYRIISAQDLPVIAEVYLNGKSELCQITSLRSTKDPTVEVCPLLRDNSESLVVDIGQITTVWESQGPMEWGKLSADIEHECNRFPVGSVELAMDRMYKSHVGKARSSNSSSLSKKQISKLITNIAGEAERAHAENVLRKLTKSGTGCSRVIDSSKARDVLYDIGKLPTTNWDISALKRAVAATFLDKDSSTGGRFKRMPCVFVDAAVHGDGTVESISVINGGWLVVDQAVRAGLEARKFADKIKDKQNTEMPWTFSDERIAQRLECFAMGELFSEGEGDDLELDIREVLKALEAPVTPNGAQDVLVKMGRWSDEDAHGKGAQPWSPAILDAARWYATRVQDQRNAWKVSEAVRSSLLEGRMDLTNIPFVCVDSKGTTFRDDAVGVRPRAGTGRKVSAASKWEILISTVDVSDIYIDQEVDDMTSKHLSLLRQAAASRAVSRYDLPLGPLHLLPPVALKALAFDTVNVADDQLEVGIGFNRCITLWAYIDERSGKLVDAGIERSVISRPVAFSYGIAADLLDSNIGGSQNSILERSRQILGIVERNLEIWSQNRRQTSEVARKREERLALKEFVAQHQIHDMKEGYRRDDGSDGFMRSRGHRLVDMSLDLYSFAVSGLLRQAKAPIPYQSGIGDARGTRVASAPLRRFVDGMVQRQLLSVLCDFGGPPLTKAECKRIGRDATSAYNSMINHRPVKRSRVMNHGPSSQQAALRLLEFRTTGDKNRPVPAVSTGRGNEVVIKGIGVVAKCRGMKEALKPGDEVMVQVHNVNVHTGALAVSLASKVQE